MINTDSKKVEYYGKIWYEVGENYLDKNFGVYTYEDIYCFDFNYFPDDIDEIEAYIKGDLMLVAGGGSSTENVLPIVFDIHKI